MGYDGTINPWFYAFLGSCLWSSNLLFILGSSLIVSLNRILKKSQKQNRWSQKTLKMQWMLFHTFFLSTVSALTLLVVPIFFLPILGFARIQAYAAPIATFLEAIKSLHSIVDYTILMYFIVPYRKFCIKCFQRVFFFVKFKEQNQTLVVKIVSTALHKNN